MRLIHHVPTVMLAGVLGLGLAACEDDGGIAPVEEDAPAGGEEGEQEGGEDDGGLDY